MADLREQIDMEKRTCSIEGCERPHSGRGWCAPHYQRWIRHGDPLGAADRAKSPCSFEECGRPAGKGGYCTAHAVQLKRGIELKPIRAYGGGECAVDGCAQPLVARGYCRTHWQRWRKHGDPLRVDQGREGSRRYMLNESYFDEITTEAQAYWLGFITADGCVIRSEKTFALRIELSERDEAHLARFRDDIGSTRPLTYRIGTAFKTRLVSASFDSWRLVESLERLGVTPRKTFTAEPWDGPADLMPHYWRGMVDGDGSIYKLTTRTEWGLDLTGSRACVEAFAAWAKQISGASAAPRTKKDGGIWMWVATGTYKPQVMAEALYGNATISLPRKQALADELRAIDWAEWRREAYRLRDEKRRGLRTA